MMYMLGKEALELKAPGQYEIHVNKDRFPGEVQIFVADSMEYLNTKQPLLSSNAEKVLVEVGYRTDLISNWCQRAGSTYFWPSAPFDLRAG